MKKIILVLFVLGFVFHVQAEQRNLQALFSYKTFYSPDKGPYIETYLSVNAQSVQYKKNAHNKFQGSIEIQITFSNETGVKYANKYNLLRPEVDDTSNIQFNFLDQQRVQLPNGKYDIGLSITDKNAVQ